MQTLEHMVRPLLMKFLLMWHLWTMEDLHATKMRLSAALLSAQTPPTPPCSLSNNSMSYLSIYLDFGQRTNHWFRKCCWCVAPPHPSSTFTDAGVWPLLRSISKGVLLVLLHLSKVKFRAHHPSVDVLDVLAGALKVGGGVVWTGDEDLHGHCHRGESFSVHVDQQSGYSSVIACQIIPTTTASYCLQHIPRSLLVYI